MATALIAAAADLNTLRLELLPLAVAVGFTELELHHTFSKDGACYRAVADGGALPFTVLAYPSDCPTPLELARQVRFRLYELLGLFSGARL